MSVEIRRRTSGVCLCGTPQHVDAPITCRHWLECDWGVLDNTEGDTRRGLHYLIITTADIVDRLLNNGPEPNVRGPGVVSVSRDADRTFLHIDQQRDGRTTWELFDAHFEAGRGPRGLLIGRWPD